MDESRVLALHSKANALSLRLNIGSLIDRQFVCRQTPVKCLFHFPVNCWAVADYHPVGKSIRLVFRAKVRHQIRNWFMSKSEFSACLLMNFATCTVRHENLKFRGANMLKIRSLQNYM